jgi:nucleotide-binding universal stress UspA family protein
MRVLVLVDKHVQSEWAVAYAQLLHERPSVTLLSAVTQATSPSRHDHSHGAPDADDLAVAHARARLYALRTKYSLGAAAEAVLLVSDPAQAVIAYIKDHPFDLVVLGAHSEHGMVKRLWAGDFCEDIVHNSESTVTIVRTPPPNFSP